MAGILFPPISAITVMVGWLRVDFLDLLRKLFNVIPDIGVVTITVSFHLVAQSPNEHGRMILKFLDSLNHEIELLRQPVSRPRNQSNQAARAPARFRLQH